MSVYLSLFNLFASELSYNQSWANDQLCTVTTIVGSDKGTFEHDLLSTTQIWSPEGGWLLQSRSTLSQLYEIIISQVPMWNDDPRVTNFFDLQTIENVFVFLIVYSPKSRFIFYIMSKGTFSGAYLAIYCSEISFPCKLNWKKYALTSGSIR